MCPLSGMVQFLVVVVTLLLICQGVLTQIIDGRKAWKVTCQPKIKTVHMYEVVNVTCDIEGPDVRSEYMLGVTSDDSNIAKANTEIWLKVNDENGGYFSESFNITGQFLGKTNVSVRVHQRHQGPAEMQQAEELEVTVIREVRVIDTVFHVSVAILVSVMYINFGCALNWGELRSNLRRPIGPVIGFVGQFLFMPLLSYGIGKLLFPGNIAMQLGMFFTGVSPGGGASNMWTVILGGNMDLSITMTAISTLASFAMMPLWLFTLGRLIFQEGKLEVPYQHISTYAITLIIPLAVGFLIQRYLKRVAQFLTRILKAFSLLLLIFIVVFAIVTNLYLFQLFSWQIIVAGLGLPWLGYSIAWVLSSVVCRQSYKDSLAIAVETGIQNTGIAIFLLRYSLPQPEADLTTVVPVSVAIMTPFPLLALYIGQKIHERCCIRHKKLENSEINSPLSELDIDNNFRIHKGPKSVSTIS